MKIIVSVLMLLLLINCFGPTLTTIGNFNITLSDVITAPGKIEKILPKNKQENKEDYENKKL